MEQLLHRWGYKLLSERLSLFMSRKSEDELMVLILDNTTKILAQKTSTNIEQEIKIGSSKNIIGSKKILTPPIFADSKLYVGLQISDFVGYTISKIERGSKNKYFKFDYYFDTIKNKFDRSEKGEIEGYGLKRWYGEIKKEWF